MSPIIDRFLNTRGWQAIYGTGHNTLYRLNGGDIVYIHPKNSINICDDGLFINAKIIDICKQQGAHFLFYIYDEQVESEPCIFAIDLTNLTQLKTLATDNQMLTFKGSLGYFLPVKYWGILTNHNSGVTSALTQEVENE